jgi:serine/threonine-protein kinase ATR
MQEKKKEIAIFKVSVGRSSRPSSQLNLEVECTQVHRVEEVLNLIPADVIARRAVECKSFARALFHWEQYIRQQRSHCIDAKPSQDLEPLYERLQDIYTQIDEPDGIEGISAHLQVLNIDQQILEHRKAGRWTAVQSWYELLLTEKPNDNDVQLNLLTSLKESGQHGKYCPG